MPEDDCADAVQGPAPGPGGGSPAGLGLRDLDADLQAVQAYADAHPAVFGGVWLEGDVLHIAFTRLTPHATALEGLLAHPEALQVHQVSRTALELEAVTDDLLELMVSAGPVRRTSLDVQLNSVEVDLRAGSPALAAQLRARYGDAVLVVDADEGPGPLPAASPGPTATADRPDLELTPLPAPGPLVGGEPGRGWLRVTNRSGRTLRLQTDQPLHACLLGPDDTITGTHLGFTTGTGLSLVLRAGQSHDIDYLVGTETAGYRVTTPGVHRLVVVLPLHSHGNDDTYERRQLVSPPISVTVTAPRS